MNSVTKNARAAAFDPIDIGPRRHKRKSLRLGMMHHHLRPGGVTSVMRDMAIALGGRSTYDSVRIDVFAAFGSEARARRIFGDAARENFGNLRMVNVPALAYRKKSYPDRESFIGAAERLSEEILAHADLSDPECPYILHSHNISLGKNPVATMAFKLVAEKAAERSLPLWLINQVHDFAENGRPEQMRAFTNCAGSRDEAFARGFMYPNAPNVIYLTINSTDIDNLVRIGIARDRIFLLPDPVDARPFAEEPIWEKGADEPAAIGLEPGADRADLMVRRLANYAASKGQIFDASLPILLSPLKVMRRKNNVESLLMLALLRHLGRPCQLLISLDAGSPPDVAYSRRLKDFAASRGMPVVIGFGHKLISDSNRRAIRNGVVTRYNLRDLYGLCSGVLVTSIVEGFGLAYHEGWLCRKPVIGRKIPGIVADFEANGMNFDHAYDRLAVSLDDLPRLRMRLLCEYEEKLRVMRGRKPFAELTRLSADDIIEAKLFDAGGRDCVDFADLSLEMQLELLGGLMDDPARAGRLIDRNPEVASAHEILENADPDGVERLIDSNRAAVRERYSLKATAKRLENIFEMGDSIYRKKCRRIPLTPENHGAVMQRYLRPENLRLIF